MNKTTEIGLADYLRAVAVLQPATMEERQEIARLCGLELDLGTVDDKPPDDTDWDEPDDDGSNDGGATKMVSPTPKRPPASADAEIWVNFSTTGGSVAIPTFEDEVDPLQKRAAEKVSGESVQKLFHNRNARAVVNEMLRRPEEGAEVDVMGLLSDLAHGKPITAFKYLTERRMYRNLQLVIDESVAMAPYRFDVQAVKVLLRQRYRAKAKPLYLGGVPQSPPNAQAADRKWRALVLEDQAPDTVTLILSTFGIGVNAPGQGAQDWLQFVNTLKDAGRKVIGLVPGKVEGYPLGLRNSLTLFPWDRMARATLVRRYAEERLHKHG